MSNIQHSSKTVEWYTPSWIIDLVKEVIPEIGLDPASSMVANRTVGAKRILTKHDDALNVVWTKTPVTVFLNPPGSKVGNKSQTALFWQKLMNLRQQGLLIEAIFMGFSLEHLAVTQSCSYSLGNFPVCIPRKRIKFVSPEGTFNSPTHSNVLAYVPGIENNTQKFKEVFSEIGVIMCPDRPAN